ncbi:ATP-binding protein [Aquimarina longa]|uniref:ATP-binding protein n=1 Tax=Aquimarina longa TaxID=1080221 RepID=UPI0007826498|nr:ATP-binding protein [Aquimarina longa]
MITSIKNIIDIVVKLHVANINNTENYALDELYNTQLQIEDGALLEIVKKYKLNFQEQVILLLALTPYFSPQTLDIFLAKNPNFDVICTEFGGTTQTPHRGVIPTAETAIFLLAARDPEKRKEVATLLLPESKLAKNNLVSLDPVADNIPPLSGKLLPHEELVQLLMYGAVKPPALSPHFPAQQLTTTMEWEDLIVSKKTKEQLNDLQNWLNYNQALQAHPELGKRAKKGYRTLFYGPSGTGKTLTASLLGKSANRPVFRIDLSLMVSKYIGETEKNLSGVFKKAEHKNWILFFDEADALFSKRTETSSSNDRFANQEVAYLLQRIENYNGMVILASNLKQNIDSAFMRRFQSLIYFPMPAKKERKLIWEKTIPKELPLSPEIDMDRLVDHYEFSASQISNIVQSCFIDTLATNTKEITSDILIKNLSQEFNKIDLLFENRL